MTDVRGVIASSVFGYAIAWTGTFLINLARAPRLIDNEKQAKIDALSSERATVQKRIALKDALGRAIAEGNRIHEADDEAQAESWVTKTHALIRESVGTGEAELFVSDAGFTFYSGKGKIRNWVSGRLQRLTDLIGRADTISIQDDWSQRD